MTAVGALLPVLYAPRSNRCCPITDLGSAREATARLGGYLPLAPGVSTVRYPIPERIFDYVSTVRSATAGTCQKRNPGACQRKPVRALRLGRPESRHSSYLVKPAWGA